MDPFDPAAWRRIAPILDVVLDAPLSEREAILDGSCAGDTELRRVVERLVRISEIETDTLDRPAVELAAELLAEAEEAPEGGLDGRGGRSSRPTQHAGDVLAGYEIRGLLGRGGMGEVFRAFHPTLERTVALKVLPAHRIGSKDARTRLIAEARAASRLDHPNVQTVYDAGETETGRVYLALALYDGPTLADRLSDAGPLTIDEVLDIVRQLADGLAAAHEGGIVHRDVKPSNLIVHADGRLKILDFGVARMTGRAVSGSGAAYGTLAYMSPEQTRGTTVGAEADVWAFGVVLYEMLAGHRPFRATNDRALVQAIRHDEPQALAERRPETPEVLVELVDRCLRKDPAERPSDMTVVRTELAEMTGAGEPSTWKSRPGMAVAGALALLAAVMAWTVLGAPGRAGVGRDATTGEPGSGSSSVLPEASAITVLPFVPVTPDSATRRLGRQLAVTLSTNLDGVGPIRTPEGLVVLSALEAGDSFGSGDPEASDSAAGALARRLGTRSYLRGTLIEAADEVRIDAALHDAVTGEEIGRMAVTGPSRNIAALTDSITLALLRNVWQQGEMPAPSLGALTTRSLPALRAYLEGEEALAESRFDAAVAAFDSAFRADSTFWYAVWRSLYPRAYYRAPPLDADRWRELVAHRSVLPEPDRLLLETMQTVQNERPIVRLEARRRIVERFPSYWPAWWRYANDLVHFGPLAGRSLAETRRALERTLELHPGFMPGWDHLFWVAIRQRDAERATEALTHLEGPRGSGSAWLNVDVLPTYRALLSSLVNGPLSEDEIDGKVDHVLGYEGPLPPEFLALDVLVHGDCGAQRAINREVLKRRPHDEIAVYHRLFAALSLACVGDWAAGVSEATSVPREPMLRLTSMPIYGLAVVGAWLGEVPFRRAAKLRPSAPATDIGVVAQAERTWLDGLLAFTDRDSAALAVTRAALDASQAEHAPRLARSLAGFEVALSGDSATAGRVLAELEEEGVASGAYHRYAAPHPWLTAVDRLAAARWRAVVGDTARALALLGWEASSLQARHGMTGPNGQLVAARAALLRARLHAARGDTARAAFHYGTIVRRYDRPAAPVQDALAEAAAYLDRPERR